MSQARDAHFNRAMREIDKRSAANARRKATVPMCQWFALCDHPAVGTAKHPTLGDVPICERCASKLKLTITR